MRLSLWLRQGFSQSVLRVILLHHGYCRSSCFVYFFGMPREQRPLNISIGVHKHLRFVFFTFVVVYQDIFGSSAS